MRRKVFTILTVVWMVVIFLFSSQDADDSTQVSNSVGKLVGRLFVPGYEQWSMEEQESFAEKIDHPVRKCAHATEYAVLGILLTGAVVDTDSLKSGRGTYFMQIGICVLIGALYACSDEIHQLFVPGRSGQVADVLIDSTGVAVGTALAAVILRCISEKKNVS
jgi:VanZ family protein